MDYDVWIKRERRIRRKMLADGLQKSKDNIYRVCGDCGEVCLCHETQCPNCDSANIEEHCLMVHDVGSRIRCRLRYVKLVAE